MSCLTCRKLFQQKRCVRDKTKDKKASQERVEELKVVRVRKRVIGMRSESIEVVVALVCLKPA